VNEAKAPPVPGVVDFLQTADRLGVTVFYVTNRDAWLEAATRANLVRYHLPVRDDIDVVLTRGEKPEWRSDKTSRRQTVARDFRIIMLMGDDLTDFVEPRQNTVAERDALLARYRDYWGDRWRVLPNPTYGSWERALYGSEDSPGTVDRTRQKLDALDPDT
jgi:acid phosphatase